MSDINTRARLPGFFNLSLPERRNCLAELSVLSQEDFFLLDQGLSLADADLMSENVIGTFALPLSIAPNFMVDGQPVLVPMVTEEPSIVAGSAKMAKIVAGSGGFITEVDESIMRGQVQVFGLPDLDQALANLIASKQELIERLNQSCPNMIKRGGGVIRLDFRVLASRRGPFLVVEPRINVVDAMGANIINSLMEHLAELLKPVLGGHIGLRILSNLCDERLVKARCSIPVNLLSTDDKHDNGPDIADKICLAQALAEADIYRACTHNKGILNGIDALALATGNDTRALAAAAHAYAAHTGSYQPLTSINCQSAYLKADICLPLAVGVVGGHGAFHTGVKNARKILGPFAISSKKLASVMASVGLAQCLAALFALSSEGIQKGHMKLHDKKLKARV